MKLLTSQARAWENAGRPERIARPVAELATRLRRYGYTVYIIGNEKHLNAQPPEDHTPYSETGWPIPSPYGWIFALDVMPPGRGQALPDLSELGEQLAGDRHDNDPGARWLKYMNWEPAGSAGQCVHDSWQPTWRRRPSTDRGHLHLSARSDCATYSLATDYDPVARIDAAKGDLQRARRLLMRLPTVGLNDQGAAVLRVQALANILLTAEKPIPVDGQFGTLTALAVRLVQRLAGIEVDGIVGPYTWAVLLGDTW